MKLSDYIAELGDARAAKTLGITERAARSYRKRVRNPRVARALRIVQRSKGRITFAECYE